MTRGAFFTLVANRLHLRPKRSTAGQRGVQQHAEDEGGVPSRCLHPQLSCSKNFKFLSQACVALFDHDQAGFPPSFFLLISHQISESLDLSFLCKPSRARKKKRRKISSGSSDGDWECLSAKLMIKQLTEHKIERKKYCKTCDKNKKKKVKVILIEELMKDRG